MAPFDLVVIAASLGGPSAHAQLLAELPPSFDAPIVVVQHRSPVTPTRLPEILARRTPLEVLPAVDGDVPLPGTVYVAPSDRQLRISPSGRFALGERPGLRPADEVLRTAAAVHGRRMIAVILTGSLDDGAAGVRAVKGAGGRVFVERPADAMADGMPLAALATGCVDHVLPIRAIASALSAFVLSEGAAALFGVPTPHWARSL